VSRLAEAGGNGLVTREACIGVKMKVPFLHLACDDVVTVRYGVAGGMIHDRHDSISAT
jgi:hypothetical protein